MKINRPTRFYSNKQEKRVAKELGGKRTANSGATPWAKGDVVLKDWLLECKTKMEEKESFTIPKKWLTALPNEAFSAGKQFWSLVFDYGDGNEYYVIDKRTFKTVVELLAREEEEQ